MAETVLLRLIRRGIVALPVHDSFIVEEQHAEALRQVMDDVLAETLRSMIGARRDSIGYSENVPQYGDTPSLDVSPDLSGIIEHASTIPVGDLLSPAVPTSSSGLFVYLDESGSIDHAT